MLRCELCCADRAEDDEDEPIGEMAERLQKALVAEQARKEHKRRLQARAALNARKGFAHGLRVGEIEGIEHGAMHARRRASEGARIGRASASEEGVGPHPRPLGLGGGCAGCRSRGGCTLEHVFLGYTAAVDLRVATPLAQWCPCRLTLRAAVEAARKGRAGENAASGGWEAVRKVASGLLPMSAAAKAMPERERRVLEAKVAKAIAELQQVMIGMLHSFREATRGERGRKQEALDAWWSRQKQRRALRARMLKLLRPWAAKAWQERKRKRDQMVHAVAGVQVAAAEERRRKTARMGGEMPCTRARGLHELGTDKYDKTKRRKVEFGWEAGDAKRGRGEARAGGGGVGGV